MDCNIAMKLVTVAPRSGFASKDGSEYLLISISFNRLLLAVCLITPSGYLFYPQSSRDKKCKEHKKHRVHEIKRFLLTDSNP